MPDYLVPLALVAVALLLVPRRWLSGPTMRRGAVLAAIAAVALVSARYLTWRVTLTLPGPDTPWAEATFAWLLFAAEMAVWFDTIILFAILARQRDNAALADAGEARLRTLDPSALPRVDIFIATYNEDLDVLEKTILGAQALDWPRDRLRICVLDDGCRDWLRDYCARKGVEHFTRADNAHAKAGNINAAIARTDGDFFMVLDADFIPQRTFLFRAMGLFDDPKVGIVQIPHSFYNADPMQVNLGMRQAMPDDQRLFFGSIMAGRDGWNAAFCCGSNSITRRRAIDSIGSALPTGSITEDILLTLALLRKGYVTRYLNERLAIGLAPESLTAMYIQRARWARGAMQLLYVPEGPFGPGLKLHQRLLFLPFHWITQPLMVLCALATPAVCLWTGWSPLPGAMPADIVSFQFPALLATLGALRLLAPEGFFPLASTVHAALQAPRVIPTAVWTLIRPHGHAFRVTPKGRAAAGGAFDRHMVFLPALLILVTAVGFLANADFNTRRIAYGDQIPLLATWAVVSLIVLSVVQAAAVSATGPNRDERFFVNLPATVASRPGSVHAVDIGWLSLTGAGLRLADDQEPEHNLRWLRLDLPGIGAVAARVVSQSDRDIRVAFALPEGDRRDRLIRLLFTTGLDNSTHVDTGLRATASMMGRIFVGRRRRHGPDAAEAGQIAPPRWLREAVAT